MKISVVLPIYNESKSLPILFDEIDEVFRNGKYDYEIIAVNDGSHDDSLEVLRKLSKANKSVKVLNFRVNSGQTAAMSAGIAFATGDIIVPMDSDLENDPKDILLLIDKMGEGYDVVSGWRLTRWKGSLITRKLPSVIANRLISKITRTHLHDYGCSLKAYKSEIVKGLPLYGEMHRFIPAYASWRGAKVTEVVVNYRPRKFGKSNYGISRTFRVLLDLLLFRFLDKYMNRPIHFFGKIGFFALSIGILSGLLAIFLRVFQYRHFVETPLPIFSALFIIVGVQLCVMGIIAEMVMRTYYESQGKKTYVVNEIINIEK